MLGLKELNLIVWLLKLKNKVCKFLFIWELIEMFGGLVGINMVYLNCIVEEVIGCGVIFEFVGYEMSWCEVKYG